MEVNTISINQIVFIKELYPRLKENPVVIEQYRAAIDKLPPIDVARGNVLVDGYNRWQAHKLEKKETIKAVDLGNLTDIQIIKESLKRNAAHGYQLNVADKKHNADRLYRMLDGNADEKYEQIAELLSITRNTARIYCQEARQSEKKQQQAQAWELWLDCWSYRQIAKEIGVEHTTISDWVGDFETNIKFHHPPGFTEKTPWGIVQHFDVWNFHTADNEGGFHGKMPSQAAKNLLWLYTEPGQIVFDPFAGSGTIIEVAKEMGRRVWASDLNPASQMLPIHTHDIVTGWPTKAPKKADFILLDPPYWIQAKGKYSDDPEDLGNMDLEGFYTAWEKTIRTCKKHLSNGGYIVFIISPAEDKENDQVVDLAFGMYQIAIKANLKPHRRIIVTYNTQQAKGQQVTWARENKKLLKLYRDLVVMRV